MGNKMSRIALLYALCASMFLFQGCLTKSDDDNGAAGGGIEGKWLATRDITAFTSGGVTIRDTMVHDTSVLARRFLVIRGTTFLEVTYNQFGQRADTVITGALSLTGGKWILDGDTLTITRTGNRLLVEHSSVWAGVAQSFKRELLAYSGAVPPLQWMPDTTGIGALSGNWMAFRARYEWSDGSYTYRDSLLYDTADVYARNFFSFRGDSIYSASSNDNDVVSGHRIGPNRWVDTDGDTLTITQAGGVVILTLSGYDPYYDESFSIRIEFVRYTRPVPPPEWDTEPVDANEPNDVSAQATTLTVGAAARSATLTYGDVDWYRFTAQAGLTYRIRTYGNSDTYLRLYAQNTTTLLAENDDDVSFNAGITWTAPSGGTYYFTVRGYGDSEQGSYSVNVTDVSGQLLKASASSGGSKKSPGRLLFHKMAGLKSP
jgi:hypothetical protein